LSRFVAEIHQCFQVAVHGSVLSTRQKRDKGLAMVDPVRLPLEAAIVCAVGPLEPLFKAARRADRVPVPPGPWRPPDPEQKRIHHAFLAQVDATVAPFLRLLADGEWTVYVRPWNDIGGRLRGLRPDETAQLSINVLRESLSLHGPRGERLYGLFCPARAAAPAPGSEPVIQSNKEWLGWAMKSIPPDHREYGWKRGYAKRLAHALKEAAKTNPALKPLKWESIAARLREIGWPEKTDDNLTTKSALP
jgi:hypothetical protein